MVRLRATAASPGHRDRGGAARVRAARSRRFVNGMPPGKVISPPLETSRCRASRRGWDSLPTSPDSISKNRAVRALRERARSPGRLVSSRETDCCMKVLYGPRHHIIVVLAAVARSSITARSRHRHPRRATGRAAASIAGELVARRNPMSPRPSPSRSMRVRSNRSLQTLIHADARGQIGVEHSQTTRLTPLEARATFDQCPLDLHRCSELGKMKRLTIGHHSYGPAYVEAVATKQEMSRLPTEGRGGGARARVWLALAVGRPNGSLIGRGRCKPSGQRLHPTVAHDPVGPPACTTRHPPRTRRPRTCRSATRYSRRCCAGRARPRHRGWPRCRCRCRSGPAGTPRRLDRLMTAQLVTAPRRSDGH